MRTVMKVAAAVSNIVLLGFVCWAIADQYPHPEEDGLIAFTVLIVLTPILSVVAIFRSGASHDRRSGAIDKAAWQ